MKQQYRLIYVPRGVSIIEIIIVVFIFGLIGTAIWGVGADIFSYNRILNIGLSANHEARQTVKKMSAEIRSISPSSLGAYPIAEASTTSFTFYVDADGDGLKERIRYFLDTGTLKKGIIVPAGIPLVYNPAAEMFLEMVHDVANGAGGTIFEYHDTNYDGTTPALAQPVNVLSVRLVKVTLIIDNDPARPPATTTVTTQMSMRNLKDNL